MGLGQADVACLSQFVSSYPWERLPHSRSLQVSSLPLRCLLLLADGFYGLGVGFRSECHMPKSSG